MYKILIIYFGLLISSIFVTSTTKFGEILPINECYKSLTNPTQYIEIEYFFPTGPLLIHINFKIKIYTNKQNGKLIETEKIYPFVRINESCQTTISFTAKGMPFQEIILTIDIQLLDHLSKIANFIYTFKNGFASGRHLLLSRYTKFGLMVRVEYFGLEYIQSIHSYLLVNFNNIEPNSHAYNDICILTNNNKEVVIRPIYVDGKPNGFISNIFIIYNEEEKEPIVYEMTAFECHLDEYNPNQSVIFFDEHSFNAKIIFYSRFMRVNDIQDEYSWALFTLSSLRREHISRRNEYSDVKKVFLAGKIYMTEHLSNDLIRTYVKSSNGEIYDTFIKKVTAVMFNVFRLEHENII